MQPGEEPEFSEGEPPAADLSPEAAAALQQVREAQATLRRLLEVIEQDGRYPVDAYRFLQEGLDHSVRRIHGATAGLYQQPAQPSKPPKEEPKEEPKEHPHHVDGRQLCVGLRELAVERWGLMAKTVLNTWNIHETRDFGEMVFVLVDNEFLQKTDTDRRDDFADVYPLREMESDYTITVREIHADETKAAESSL